MPSGADDAEQRHLGAVEELLDDDAVIRPGERGAYGGGGDVAVGA